MDGVAFGLATRSRLRLLQLEPSLILLRNCVRCLQPDLIVFEIGAPWSESLLSLLHEQPEVRLAGLDTDNCRVVMLTRHQFLTESMQELLNVIQQQTVARPLARRR
jgi:hypothetical protein